MPDTVRHRAIALRIGVIVATVAMILVATSPEQRAVAAPLFTDDFSSGTLANWTGSTNVTITTTLGATAPPSARAAGSASAAYAWRVLAQPVDTICMQAAMNVETRPSVPLTLLRLRTAANGPVSRVFVATDGVLVVRSDVTSTQRWSGVAVGTGWHTLELCGTVGASGTWDLYRDGVRIVTGWAANTGTTAIGRVEFGDASAKTFVVNVDDVVVTTSHTADVTPPTVPGTPSATSPVAGSIALSWSGSQDASPPITYRVYRDAGATPVGTTTSTTFTDAGLTPGTTHTYTVDAVDAVGNASAMSTRSQPVVVSGSTTQTVFSDTFASGTFANWTGVTRLTIDTTRGSAAPPSARAQVTGLAAFAYRALGSPLSRLCVRANVNLSSIGSANVVLVRLRTAANGPVIRVYATSGRILMLRADVTGATVNSGVSLGTGWHSLELCGSVGASSAWTLTRDGVAVVNGWTANTGTTPAGRVEIGDTAAKTFTANFDDVAVTTTSTQPPQHTSPNILIFLTDDQRASDTVTPTVMPKLRQWLMTGGREYTSFFDTTPLCCPDRSVVLSGRYAHNTGVRTNPDGANLDQSRTMERLLLQQGYDSAYVGKFLNDWKVGTPPPYFNHWSLVGGGYTNQFWNVDGVGKTYPDYTTDFIGDRAVAYLDRFETDDARPWFLFVATPAPHYPYQPAAKYATADVGTWAGNPATAESDRSDKPPWVRARTYSLTQAAAVRVPQLRTLMSVDDMVGQVMTRTQQLGELGNTLVLYTSDNGYVWSEHHLGGDYGTAGQKRYPYTDSVRVPMFVRWDGHVSAGTTDGRLTGTVDIVPTVLEAAGVTADYPLDGRSLLSDFTRQRILLEYWLDPGDATIPTWISMRTASLQFVEYYDANGNVSFREYYDLARDPWELVNLLNDGDPANPDVAPLSAEVRSDATCSGTSETVPAPTNPCP